MGVSDGVYAWREKGIDAGLYSQKLMEYARLSVSMGTTDVLRGTDLDNCQMPVGWDISPEFPMVEPMHCYSDRGRVSSSS